MLGDRRGRKHPLGSRDRGAVEAGERPRRAALPEKLDNGSEFIAKAILRWLSQEQIETALIDPGKPWQNGSNESFNGKFRDECLSMQWFKNRVDAKILIEDWRQAFNTVRPHSSLSYQTPAAFAWGLSQHSMHAIF
jgi:putative transposase